MEKELCKCNKVALWWYAPATDQETMNRYYCDDCVPRGCECNHEYVDQNFDRPDELPRILPNLPEEDEKFIWIEENKIWAHIDDKGRKWPCVEFWYEENGWDID